MQQLRKKKKKITLKAISWLEEERKPAQAKPKHNYSERKPSLPSPARVAKTGCSPAAYTLIITQIRNGFFLSVPSVAADERGCEVA